MRGDYSRDGSTRLSSSRRFSAVTELEHGDHEYIPATASLVTSRSQESVVILNSLYFEQFYCTNNFSKLFGFSH